MQADPVTIKPEATLQQAAQKLLQRKVHRLPVVDERGALVGLITRHDIVVALASASPAGPGDLLFPV